MSLPALAVGRRAGAQLFKQAQRPTDDRDADLLWMAWPRGQVHEAHCEGTYATLVSNSNLQPVFPKGIKLDKMLFELADMQIWKRGDRYFVRYDAGAHQVAIREDEITEDEAISATKSGRAAVQMLHNLQKRLIEAGIDPYISNL